jgi:hypothetical protein
MKNNTFKKVTGITKRATRKANPDKLAALRKAVGGTTRTSKALGSPATLKEALRGKPIKKVAKPVAKKKKPWKPGPISNGIGVGY